MKKSSIALIGIVGVLFILVLWFIGTNNTLISLKENVEMQQSQVETTLQRRSDLIPNLIETVKGYVAHEEKVFTEVAEARAKLAGTIETGDVESISQANDSLSSSLSRLLAISENYPDLKASEQFTALQDELAGTENRISVARQYYNESVAIYNKKVQYFPSSIIASARGFYPKQYFEAAEGSEKVPNVSFD